MSVQEIHVDDLAAALAAGTARLIDVREREEFETARVAGGRLIPMGTVPARIDEFAGEPPAFVICRSGARSMRVCEFLAEHGVEAINVAGGTIAWVESGRDVMSGPE